MPTWAKVALIGLGAIILLVVGGQILGFIAMAKYG